MRQSAQELIKQQQMDVPAVLRPPTSTEGIVLCTDRCHSRGDAIGPRPFEDARADEQGVPPERPPRRQLGNEYGSRHGMLITRPTTDS